MVITRSPIRLEEISSKGFTSFFNIPHHKLFMNRRPTDFVVVLLNLNDKTSQLNEALIVEDNE